MTQMILPQHANSIGIAFGGQVMRWMEQCAFIAASRVCRGGHLLTAAMDSISFLSPTRVGDMMFVEGQVSGAAAVAAVVRRNAACCRLCNESSTVPSGAAQRSPCLPPTPMPRPAPLRSLPACHRRRRR